MITISENIQLKPILASDSETLFRLMKEVYPLAYSHFWVDKGDWYVKSQYSKENILKELSIEKAAYFFVLYNDEIIGNFRFVWDEKLVGLSEEKQLKLHRIYLHQKTQGKAFEFYKKMGYTYHSHTFLPFDLLHKEVRKMSQVFKKLDEITH